MHSTSGALYAVDFAFVTALLGVNASGSLQQAGKDGLAQDRAQFFLTFVRLDASNARVC